MSTTVRVLPAPWKLTAADVAKLCGQPLDDPPRTILVADVEGLCRGAMADAQRRGSLARDIETSDWLEVLGFLFGEVVVHTRKYDPGRRGIEFRPWLYARIRAFSVVDAQRWLYGRDGRHHVNGGFHADDDSDDDWNLDVPDPCDDSREARLEQALSGGSVDGPEYRLDDLFGVHSGEHRELLRAVPGLGGAAGGEPPPRDLGPGLLDHSTSHEEVAA